MTTDYELAPTRQSLLSRLKDWDDAASWQDFFDTYWRVIYRTARKAGLNDVEAQDVVQETLISVSKRIGDFRYDPGRGTFKGWLFQTTTWRIRDHLRKQQRAVGPPGQEKDEHPPEILGLTNSPGPSIAPSWDADWELNLADAALDRVKKQIPPKQFQIFDLAIIRHWPTAKIAKTLSVSAGYVYVIKHRVSSQLRREVRKLRSDPHDTWHSGAKHFQVGAE